MNNDLFGTPILTNTLYVLYLTLDTGSYRARLARDTVGFIGQAVGTYSGLTTWGAVLCLGNNCQDQTNGFPGSMDRVRLISRPLTVAEEDSDCAALIDGCGAPRRRPSTRWSWSAGCRAMGSRRRRTPTSVSPSVAPSAQIHPPVPIC